MYIMYINVHSEEMHISSEAEQRENNIYFVPFQDIYLRIIDKIILHLF